MISKKFYKMLRETKLGSQVEKNQFYQEEKKAFYCNFKLEIKVKLKFQKQTLLRV